MDPHFLKRRRREKLYDKLHRGFVNTCIGITAAASLYIGYKAYEYFRYIRPLQLAQSQLVEKELLLEGKSIEESSNVELST